MAYLIWVARRVNLGAAKMDLFMDLFLDLDPLANLGEHGGRCPQGAEAWVGSVYVPSRRASFTAECQLFDLPAVIAGRRVGWPGDNWQRDFYGFILRTLRRVGCLSRKS